MKLDKSFLTLFVGLAQAARDDHPLHLPDSPR